MTPIHKVALGLIVVLLQADFAPVWSGFEGWDAFPNPVGWALILWGLRGLGDRVPAAISLQVLAVLALVISVITYPPSIVGIYQPEPLDDDGRLVTDVVARIWMLALPLVAFSLVLAQQIGSTLGTARGERGRKFRYLTWLFGAAALLPPVALGTEVPAYAGLGSLVLQIAQLALIWLLFVVARDERLGGWPRPVRPPKPSGDGAPGNDEGRPPTGTPS